VAAGDAGNIYTGLPPDRILSINSGDRLVDGMRPEIAIRPQTPDEVCEVLRDASENGLAVIPWGGGGLMDLGNKPERYDVALDISGLNAIVEHSPEDLVVTAQAGMALGALNRYLAERGQFLALDAPLAEKATIGGALSANLPGPARLRYGTARDLVIGMSCVLSSGQRVHSGGRVVKNVAGYDLNKLYLGAIGSLGVIVEVSFKLHPLPQSRAAVAGMFRNFKGAHEVGLAIANSSLGATAVEIAANGMSSRISPMAGADYEVLLIVSVAGLTPAVERQTSEISEILQRRGALATIVLDGDQGWRLLASIRDFGRADYPAPLLIRCNVLPHRLPEALQLLEVDALVGEAALTASPAAGNLRLAWEQLPREPLRLIEAIRLKIAGLDGNAIIERCPSDLKEALDVWGVEGADVALMRDMKAAYDPTRTLSSGRFVNRL
jgi:glycolate oxidase FAD binding subunit